MLQMMLMLHEMLTNSRHEEYLREMEQYRRAVEAERGRRSGQQTGSRTVTKIRRALARAGIARVPAPRPVGAKLGNPDVEDTGRERRIA